MLAQAPLSHSVSRIKRISRMTEKKPSEWGNDPLSVFFKDAEYNNRVTALNLPAVYELLQRVNTLFKQFEDVIEKDTREEFLLPRFLMVRTHSSYLAGLRLAMSGQVSEAFPVLDLPSNALGMLYILRKIQKVPNDPRLG